MRLILKETKKSYTYSTQKIRMVSGGGHAQSLDKWGKILGVGGQEGLVMVHSLWYGTKGFLSFGINGKRIKSYQVFT